MALIGRFFNACAADTASGRWLLFVSLFWVAFLIFTVRTPSPLLYPQFATEDGTQYFHDVSERGLFEALQVRHRGYHVFGNILIAAAGLGANSATGGSLADAPLAVSLASYVFFAALAASPALLLRRRLRPACIVLLAILIAGMPFNRDDFMILGRASNTGYFFLYLAVLLLICRHRVADRYTPVIDVLLFICANTNPVVFLALPFAAWRSWQHLRRCRSLLNHLPSLSLAMLALACAVEVFLYLTHTQTDSPFLKTPFHAHRLIELTAARLVLYPFVLPFYEWLNDSIVLLLLTLCAAVVIRIAAKMPGAFRYEYILVSTAVAAFTVATAAARPGLTGVLTGYVPGEGPSHYFLGVNVLVMLLATLVLNDLSILNRGRAALAASACVAALWLPGAVFTSTFAGPTQQVMTAPAFRQSLESALVENPPDQAVLPVRIYPGTPDWHMHIRRSDIQGIDAEPMRRAFHYGRPTKQ
jgi:hypothetical protein